MWVAWKHTIFTDGGWIIGRRTGADEFIEEYRYRTNGIHSEPNRAWYFTEGVNDNYQRTRFFLIETSIEQIKIAIDREFPSRAEQHPEEPEPLRVREPGPTEVEPRRMMDAIIEPLRIDDNAEALTRATLTRRAVEDRVWEMYQTTNVIHDYVEFHASKFKSRRAAMAWMARKCKEYGWE